jgi:GNAT superfamily N-acetyltransferase
MEILDVHAGNVSQTGFFCYMSKKKAPGYSLKMNWLKERFREGLKIKMLRLPDRGFIEYLPGEYAWRPVNAAGYLFIHCLWVVGKSKGQGHAGRLLEAVIKDAEERRSKGIAMVTSEGNWLSGRKILEKHGFTKADQAPPSFSLMVKRLDSSSSLPAFTGDWEEKARKCGKGMTAIRTDQCPYIEDASTTVKEAARELGYGFKEVVLRSADEIRTQSPSAFGTFGIVLGGRLLSYHYLLKEEILKRVQGLGL